MRHSRATLATAVSLFAVVLATVGPASALSMAQSSSSMKIVELLGRTNAPALQNIAQVQTDESGNSAVETTLNRVKIQIPTLVSQPLRIEGTGGKRIGVSLPVFQKLPKVQAVAPGVVAYNNGNGSITSPVVRSDGSVQIFTVIGSPDAPTNYDYQLQVPSGAEIKQFGESILIVHEGELLAGIAPAWAKDANGRSVPTKYLVSGSDVIQIIEHSGGQYKYPVTADPWLGIALFGHVTVDTYRNQPRVNLDLSPWGWAVYAGINPGGFLAGQIILNNAGWDEAWGMGGAVRSALDKPSQRQQFSCHALGAVFAGTWNLEKYRPNRLNGDWSSGLAVHRCNWETAERF